MRMKNRLTVLLALLICLASTNVQGSFHKVSISPGSSHPVWNRRSFPAPYQISHTHHDLYSTNTSSRRRLEKKTARPRRRKFPHENFIQNKATCDGKANLITDIGLFAIITGALDALMSLYSTGFTSIVSNAVSAINVFFSFAFGIPSAILTYLAASDRVSYTVANVLSMLSFANTFYGIWSVDKGNLDILTSTAANAIGVFSLLLSVATAYPSLIDDTINFIGDVSGDRRAVNRFVNRYGCSKHDPTLKVMMDKLFEEFM